MGADSLAHRPTVRRIGILAIEGCNADGLGWHEGWIEEFRGIRDTLHPCCCVYKGNQAVRLTAAERGIEAENS